MQNFSDRKARLSLKLEIDPYNVALLTERCHISMFLGENTDALRDADLILLLLDPRHVDVALMLVYRAVAKLHLRSDMVNAKDDLQQACTMRPELRHLNTVVCSMGFLHVFTGDLKGSIQYAKEALSRHPRYMQTHVLNGIVAAKLGSVEHSIEHFEHALEFCESATIYLAKGRMCLTAGRYDDAIADFTRSLELSRADEPRTLLYRSMAYVAIDDITNALADIEASFTFDPNDPQIASSYATITMMAGNVDAACAMAETLYKSHPWNPSVISATVAINMHIGNEINIENRISSLIPSLGFVRTDIPPDARHKYSTTVDRLSGIVVGTTAEDLHHSMRAAALFELGEYDAAFADVNHVIKSCPTYLHAICIRADIYRIKGNMAACVADMNLANDHMLSHGANMNTALHVLARKYAIMYANGLYEHVVAGINSALCSVPVVMDRCNVIVLLMLRGLCWAQTSQTHEAMQSIRDVKQWLPHRPIGDVFANLVTGRIAAANAS